MKLIIATLLILLLPGPIWAESAQGLVESGNRAYEQSDYGTALDYYERAAKDAPDSAVVLFDKGNALYKKGEYAEAFNVYEQAAAKAMTEKDPELEAMARYNMGNSAFRQAEVLSRENPEMSLEEFNRSSENFDSAVKLAPGLTEAGHNLEVSRMAAKQVEEMLRKQQQQAQQQQQAEEQIKQELEELSREQNEAAKRSERAAGQQSQGAERRPGEQLDDLAEMQQEITEKTKSVSDRLGQLSGSGQENISGADKHVERAIEKQEAARKNLQENKPAQAGIAQEEAAGELAEARRKLEEGKKGTEGQEATPQAQENLNDNPGEGQEEFQEGNEKQAADDAPSHDIPAGETPEDIINEEIEGRKYRRAGKSTGLTPVEKDW